MKKIFTRIALALLGLGTSLSVYAVPACPTPAKVLQPDGTYITVTLVGDEFSNLTITTDGYAVVYNPVNSAWEYAVKAADGQMISAGMLAHDPGLRSKDEKSFISSKLEKTELGDVNASEEQKAMLSAYQEMTAPSKAPIFDYSKFKGLIILAEYSDVPFMRSDFATIANDMANKENFDGFMSDGVIPEKINCTGSLKDYFNDNSAGMFRPHFDVIGPVKISYTSTYVNQTSYAQTLIKGVLKAADELINYKDYDADGDGVVDMFYVIFSGAGSNFGGNDSRLVWPHASQVVSYALDGVSFGRYACSTELFGKPANKQLDGIGVICHEFSHVLGLPDLYDTDYSTGGQSIHPNNWSVMASGSYLNDSKTPCGYNVYERYAAGFLEPELLEETADYTVQPIHSSNKGYRINTGFDKEYFLLENRQQVKWNEYLPGHGMLVYRVDLSNPQVWTNNKINATSSHNYFELLRATPKYTSSTTVADSGGDPFPGTGNVTSITHETSPSLIGWAKIPSVLTIENIAENDGIISFKGIKKIIPNKLETFNNVPVTTSTGVTFDGDIATWTVAGGAQVADVEIDGKTERVVTMIKGSTLTSGVINLDVNTVEFEATNPTTRKAMISLEYSTNKGVSWTSLKEVGGNSSYPLESKSSTKISFPCLTQTIKDAMFRVKQSIGDSSNPIYIDNFNILYNDDQSGINDIFTDGTDLEVIVSGNTVNINGINPSYPVNVYSITGVRVAEASGVETVTFTLASKGVYIISNGTATVKVSL